MGGIPPAATRPVFFYQWERDMPSNIRLKRIADRMKEDLSEMLVKEIQDPRLSGVSITDVKVDRELAYAEVFVSAVEGEARHKEIIAGMQHAGSYLRTALAARIDLRVFPRLRFHWDPTPERADRVEQILASLRNDAPPDEPDEGEETHA
jgi:ribosome-binding factor A